MKKAALLLLSISVLLLVVAGTAAADNVKPWTSHFTYEVPAWTWSDGVSVDYQFYFAWTYPDEGELTSGINSFAVSDEAALYPGYVVFRGNFGAWAQVDTQQGRQCMQLTPPFTIHPAQPVRFHIGWRTDEDFTPVEARAFFESMVTTVDYGAGPVAMEDHEVVPYVQDNYWEKRICSYTH